MKTFSPSVSRPFPTRSIALGLVFALAGLTGCSGTIRWRSYHEFEPVLEESRQAGKATFVYLRSWYLVQCTKFEDEVLRDPAVVKATQPMNCIMLDFDNSSRLTRAWGLTEAPAFVVFGPEGALRGSGSGRISRESLLAALRGAAQPAASQPTP